MKKILYIHDTLLSSEQANLIQVISMCEAFSKLGHEVILAVPKSNIEIEEAYEYINNLFSLKHGFKIIYFKKVINNKISKYLDHYKIKKIITNNNPDLCYVRNVLFLKESIKNKVNTIYETHNNKLHLGSKFINRILLFILKQNSKKEKLIKIICISNELKKYWGKNGLPIEKLEVLHDGFKKEYFIQYRGVKETKKKLGFPTNKKIVMYTGSLYHNREISSIISLASNIKDVIFIVIGGPEKQKEYYEKEARLININNIKFMGRIDHKKIPEFLFSADVLLALWSSKVQTINYCSPLKLFEYMAAGRHIVATGFPTILEVLKDKKNAFISEPDNYNSLLKTMKEALSMNYPSKIAENARDDAFNYYSWTSRASFILNDI